jgi:hypothetical protein
LRRFREFVRRIPLIEDIDIWGVPVATIAAVTFVAAGLLAWSADYAIRAEAAEAAAFEASSANLGSLPLDRSCGLDGRAEADGVRDCATVGGFTVVRTPPRWEGKESGLWSWLVFSDRDGPFRLLFQLGGEGPPETALLRHRNEMKYGPELVLALADRANAEKERTSK